MTTSQRWQAEHSVETAATPTALWRLFADVAGWRTWNSGIETVEMHGPFTKGTRFTMKPPGQDAFESELVEVRENALFVDETRIEDLVVTVAHRIAPSDGDRTRITYAIEVSGPGADEIGPAIASDFPEVLAALAKKAIAS